MSERDDLSEADLRRLAEASAWRVTLSEADAATSDDFERWLAADPANGEAWDDVQASWGLVGEQSSTPEFLALRRAALQRAERSRARPAPRWSATGWWPRIAACLILVVAAGLAWRYVGGFDGGHRTLAYATERGERRVITLADGSKVSLDSASAVEIEYSPDARKLELKRGQARFDVAHDVTRPFLVRAGDRMVVATGTAFNVDLAGPHLQVTLIEGRVVILPRDADPDRQAIARTPQVQLIAGQRFTESAGSAPGGGSGAVEAADLTRATAWESGQLMFEDEPLGTIVDRVSRYSEVKLRADPSVAALRISGVFHTGDVAGFLDVAEHYLPVKDRRLDDGTILLIGR